jgi:hypothetical protein
VLVLDEGGWSVCSVATTTRESDSQASVQETLVKEIADHAIRVRTVQSTIGEAMSFDDPNGSICRDPATGVA